VKIKIFFLSLFFLLAGLAANAQKNNFTSYTIRDGLPQNTVFKIFQDSKGYLWLATDGGGVSRFDGRTHKYLKKRDGLSNNVVRDILEDRKGNMWFATMEGVSLYNGKDFKNFSEADGLGSNIVTDLFEDSQGRIWAASSGGGLSQIIVGDSVVIDNYTTSDGLSSNRVLTIVEDEFQRLWLGFIGGAPQMVTLESGEISIVEVSFPYNYDINAIYCGSKDKKGNIWFGSVNNGVYRFSNINEGAEADVENYSILNGLKDNFILDIVAQDSVIWIATNDGGINYIKDDGIHFFNEQDGLASNQILDLFIDREANLWVSCMGEGIQKLNGFEFSHYSVEEGLISDQLSFIGSKENDSNLWISTYDKGLQELRIKDNKIVNKRQILNDLELYNSIRTFDFDANGNLWIGTQYGIVVWNEEILAKVGSERIAGDKINSLLCAENGWVWIGTSSGLSFYNGDYGVFREEDGFINNEIQTIIEASDGTIWIGTLGGLASYKDEIMVTYDQVEGLSNLKVHSLAEANDGKIIIGTYGGGIFSLDRSIDSLPIREMMDPNGLTSPNVYSLVFENDSTLIVGTDKGVDKLVLNQDVKVKSVQHFNENNGFLAIENNINAIYYDPISASVLFGTVNGLTTYSSALEDKIKYKPTINLENIKLFNQDVDWTKFGEVDSNQIPLNLSLPYDQNFITFRLSGIYFSNPENITYQYRLLGLGDTWFYTESGEVVFQGLEPNEYTLEVRAITENDQQSEAYSFSFTIAPPFYKTWWFYTICVIVLALGITIYIRLNLRRLRREKVILENTVAERTKEIVAQKDIIEEKNQEILDSINYAQGIQQAILPDKAKLNAYFDDYLVLFNPKDIVSGDFYWAHQKGDKIYFMAADCTGHGVPGSIMSVVGHTSLETTLKYPEELNAGEFLDKLNQNVLDILLQSEEHSVKDGMDVGLCIYNMKEGSLQFAGANNPMYIIRSVESGFSEDLSEKQLSISTEEYNLFEFKANKQPIGDYEHRVPFDTHTIKLQPKDTIYVFSDGFPDQFGGPKGKKYKYRPFKRFLLDIQKQDLGTQKQRLSEELYQWMHPEESDNVHEQIDDVLVFGVRFNSL
jgi:ligand-binding sensor domain-containing protein/serine phosphatase RsbU (regulator of sigma subunit)